MSEKGFDRCYQSLSLSLGSDNARLPQGDRLYRPAITNEEVAWAIACVRALDEVKARGGNPEATGTA